MLSLLFLILAALALGVLIFIHELGHYWMARRVGIRVEAFSIGFGRPLVKWVKNGVEWRIGWLPMGGYVRMAGESKSEGKQPHEIEGSFFAARPIDRIKVALAGPVVNIVFAFLLFVVIWLGGGRDKPFQDFTNRIGWVDEHSELYEDGIRPGDMITAYDGYVPKAWHEHASAPLLADDTLRVQGFEVNYPEETKRSFDLRVAVYPHPQAKDDNLLTAGILVPAEYLLLRPFDKGRLLLPGSPLDGSGLRAGDRLLWLDGQLLFSQLQMSHLLDQERALLTIQRGDMTLLKRVPRIPVGELILPDSVRFELGDWHYDSGIAERFLQTRFIPYALTSNGTIEGPLQAIDQDTQEAMFPEHPFSELEAPLQVGDRILAVDGVRIERGAQLLELLQRHRVHLMVQHRPQQRELLPASEANQSFDADVRWGDVQNIADSIGSLRPITKAGDLELLEPFLPTTYGKIAEAGGENPFGVAVAAQRKEIALIPNPEQRAQAGKELHRYLSKPAIGVSLADREVRYNPLPTTLLWNSTVDIYRLFKAVVTGSLNPRWLSGPVGIVQIIHQGWRIGVKEAFFWVGLISLNLGILNLLPIPVLDGGNICFSLWELITRRRIRPEVMEKLIIPFVVFMIGFFLFVTYHDLSRLFRGLF